MRSPSIRRAAWRARSLAPALLALSELVLFGACEGSGSDVGPRFDDADRRVLVGTVLDRRGEPLRAVHVRIGSASGASDASGRFRVIGPPRGKAKLEIDGALATAPDGRFGFGALAFELDFAGSRDELDRPVVLPAAAESARGSFALGVALSPGTELLDPRTGARLALGGAILRWSAATPPPASVELSFGVLDAADAPAPPATGEILQNGSVALVDPLGIAVEGARIELPDERAFASAAEPLRAWNLRGSDGLYAEVGSASVSAGMVVLEPASFESGALFAARTLSPAQTTAIEGLILDPDGTPVAGATVSAGEKDARAKSNGEFAIDELPAVDGTGAPLDLELRIEAPQGWRSGGARVAFTADPGQSSDLGEIALDTANVVDFRGLVVRRGLEDVGRRVTIGNLNAGKRSAWSDDKGKVAIFDFPLGQRTGFDAHLNERSSESKTFADGRSFNVSGSSGYRESRLFLDEKKLRRTRLEGSAQYLVYVRGTVAPIEKAFCMIGLDGTKKGRRRASSTSGTASFGSAGTEFGIFTVGMQTDARSQDGIHERDIAISYHTYFGVDSRLAQMQISTAVDRGSRPAGDPYAAVLAELVGLTDPIAVPPANSSYVALGRARRQATRGEIAAELFGLEVDAPISSLDRPALDETADFNDPHLALALPLEPAYAIALERDADAQGRGPVTAVGLSGPLDVEGGTAVSRVLSMQPAGTAPRTLILNDLDPAFAGATPLVQFGWELAENDAVLAGALDDATWTFLERRLDLAPPRAPAPFGGEAFAHVRFAGSDPLSTFEQQAVVPAGAGTSGFDLVIVPRLLTPAPQGSLDPEVGLTFTADSRASVTQIALRRSETIKVDGVLFLARYEWIVDVAPGVQEIAFPILPDARVGGREVPQFFQPGTYELEILSWRSEHSDFHDRAAFRDVLDDAEGVPLAASRYRTTLVVP